MLGKGAGFDALALANPWTIESDDGVPPPQAVRARYAGNCAIREGAVAAGDRQGLLRPSFTACFWPHGHPAPALTSSSRSLPAAGLSRFTGPLAILLAERDRNWCRPSPFAGIWAILGRLAPWRDLRLRRSGDARDWAVRTVFRVAPPPRSDFFPGRLLRFLACGEPRSAIPSASWGPIRG